MIIWDSKNEVSKYLFPKYKITIAKNIIEKMHINQTKKIGDIPNPSEILWINSPGKPLLTNPPA